MVLSVRATDNTEIGPYRFEQVRDCDRRFDVLLDPIDVQRELGAAQCDLPRRDQLTATREHKAGCRKLRKHARLGNRPRIVVEVVVGRVAVFGYLKAVLQGKVTGMTIGGDPLFTKGPLMVAHGVEDAWLT